MDKTVNIASKYFSWCATEIRLSADDKWTEREPIVVSVSTGASRLQTYATVQEVRELAAALLAIADEVDVVEAEVAA